MLTISSLIRYHTQYLVSGIYCCISDIPPSLTFVSMGMPWAGRQDSRSRPNTSTFADGVREQIRLQQEATAAAAAAPPPFPSVQGLRITLTGVRVTSYSQTEPESQTRKGCSSNVLRKLDSHILSVLPRLLFLPPSLPHSITHCICSFAASPPPFRISYLARLLPSCLAVAVEIGRMEETTHLPTTPLYGCTLPRRPAPA